ncbi:MAG: molybdopterin converting factor small subunit [Planctomycetota bacterium]|jgi:molybdopterin converting factor small subunit
MSMRITIELMAQLRVVFGAGALQLEVPAGATLAQVLQQLVRDHGDESCCWILDEDGARSRTVIATLAGATLPPGSDPALSDGDSIFLFSPIAGG